MLPSFFDDDDEEEITIVGTMSEDVKALRRGYRKQEPPTLLRDDAPDIQITGEADYDALLIEELIDDRPVDARPRLRVESAGATDRGRKRPVNQDAVLLMDPQQTYLVADGMGGHVAGEVASRMALEVIEHGFTARAISGAPHILWPVLADELARSIEMANTAVHRAQAENKQLEGMATTVTGLRFSLNRERAYVAHVGDSRCYRVRGGKARVLTLDHTIANLIGVQGPIGQQLSRGVGVESSVEVDVTVDVACPGDVYVLCSDGLTKMLHDHEIANYVNRGGDLAAIVKALIDEANRRGGKDNIAVVLIRVDRAR